MRLDLRILLVSTTFLFNSISGALLTPTKSSHFRNYSESHHILSRQKRFLVFPGGGTAKFVGGYLGPIDTPAYINCNAIRNLQYQFDLPQNIIWNPQTWPGYPSKEARSFNDNSTTSNNPSFQSDSSRRIAYEVIEDVLNREGKNGRECMLRAICEVSETPVDHDDNGIVGELLQTFFTPGKYEKIDEDYRHAQLAGHHHVNCEKLYPDCPLGHGILDSFSLVREFGLVKWLQF